MKTFTRILTLFGIALLLLTATLIYVRRQAPEQWMIYWDDGQFFRVGTNGSPRQILENLPPNSLGFDWIASNGWLYFYTMDVNEQIDIYRMRLNGKNIQRLNHKKFGWNIFEQVTNDGDVYIGFQTVGGYDIFRFTSNEKQLINLTHSTNISEQIITISPDEEQIIFYAFPDRNLFSINRNGRHKTQLTTISADYSFATWAPDGQWILVLSDLDDGWNLYRLNIDGTHFEQITDIVGIKYPIEWIPQNNWVVFSALNGEHLDIYRIHPDGSELLNLTQTDDVDETVRSVSPDGKWIVLEASSNPNSGLYGYDLGRVSIDGGDIMFFSAFSVTQMFIDWSPDHSRIIYHQSAPTSPNVIYSTNPDGTDPIQLSPVIDHSSPIGWTDDDEWFIYQFDDEFYRVRIDGTGRTQLTFGSTRATFLTFSPTIDLTFNPISMFIASLALIGGSLCVVYYFSRS